MYIAEEEMLSSFLRANCGLGKSCTSNNGTPFPYTVETCLWGALHAALTPGFVRVKILGLEQACQVAEVAMLQAQEEAADFESLAQDAAEDADAAASESQRAVEGGSAENASSRFGCLHTGRET